MNKLKLNYSLDAVIGLAFALSGVTGLAFLLMGEGGWTNREDGFMLWQKARALKISFEQPW